ncbi:ANTAR domain-containing protein [Lapillicoccus sp.]|jgi:hypothetical protein|uniref:ANTAR domain-containing response regulator n=1 Tax=Lapillicoccus sp. TaxID=1909287 RepID=UPI0025F10F8E|nr:ANTAR domain-containing protein [Lapillicoccus sp.]
MESAQWGPRSISVDDDLLLTLERLDEQVRSLQAALLSNRRIGVAVGIVMNELRITESAAFEALRRFSMDSNRKLRDVAEDVIDTGELPDDLRRRVLEPIPLRPAGR